MTSELVTLVADELDIFLREKGMFIGRDDLEDLAEIVIGAVDLYVEDDNYDEDDDDLWGESLEEV
jgi:hypothetical protein